MKLLILGGDGMLGHQLLLSYRDTHSVKVTLRKSLEQYQEYNLFNKNNTFDNIDARNFRAIADVIRDYCPDVVINCIGVVKQRDEVNDCLPTLKINSLLPRYLEHLCNSIGVRFIHVSTDCVFSGDKGDYIETDLPDAKDLYGVSKYLGEVFGDNCLTLRTSIIGLELSHKKSLVEWFLAQQGEIKGYKNAIYSGVTTLELARLMEYLFSQKIMLSGLYNVSSKPISKYELLSTLLTKLERNDIEIEEDVSFVCDRSLNSQEFFSDTNYEIPSWDVMLTELADQIKKRK